MFTRVCTITCYLLLCCVYLDVLYNVLSVIVLCLVDMPYNVLSVIVLCLLGCALQRVICNCVVFSWMSIITCYQVLCCV